MTLLRILFVPSKVSSEAKPTSQIRDASDLLIDPLWHGLLALSSVLLVQSVGDGQKGHIHVILLYSLLLWKPWFTKSCGDYTKANYTMDLKGMNSAERHKLCSNDGLRLH